MAEPSEVAGKYTLVIKYDGGIATHFLTNQQYGETQQEVDTLGVQVCSQNNLTFQACAVEASDTLEAFINGGGVQEDLDVVDGSVVYP